MPATAKTRTAEPKEHVRLKRSGPRGECGLKRYYFEKKLWKREGIYSVPAPQARLMVSTGNFERIHPDDLERAMQQARQDRGISVNDRVRIRRREAQRRRRRHEVVEAEEEPLIDTGGEAAEAGGDEPSVEV